MPPAHPDSLLCFGNAVGEIVLDHSRERIAGLYLPPLAHLSFLPVKARWRRSSAPARAGTASRSLSGACTVHGARIPHRARSPVSRFFPVCRRFPACCCKFIPLSAKTLSAWATCATPSPTAPLRATRPTPLQLLRRSVGSGVPPCRRQPPERSATLWRWAMWISGSSAPITSLSPPKSPSGSFWSRSWRSWDCRPFCWG